MHPQHPHGSPPGAAAADAQPDYNQLVQFKRWGVEGPALVYLTVDDYLLLEVWLPIITSSFTLTLRMLRTDGTVVPIQYGPFPVITTLGSIPFSKLIPGVEGFIVSASFTSNAPQRGQTFARLTIQRGTGSGDIARGMVLLQGYASAFEDCAWPNGVIQSPLNDRGGMRSVPGVAPAAGAEIVDVVPTGVNWIIRSLSYQLTTSVAVATRLSHIVIDDGVTILWEGTDAGSEAASLVLRYSWSGGANPATDAGGVVQGTIPSELRMRPGWRIRTVTSALQAGDQYTAAQYLVEEFVAAG